MLALVRDDDAYRAELEAAHARIAALEEQLREKDELVRRTSKARKRELRRERKRIERSMKKNYPEIGNRYGMIGFFASLFFVVLSIPLGHVFQFNLVLWSLVMAIPSFATTSAMAARARTNASRESRTRIAEIDAELDAPHVRVSDDPDEEEEEERGEQQLVR